MTYGEAYKIVEAALLENCGWFPAGVYEALEVLGELVREVEDEGPILSGYGLDIGQ